MSSIRLKGVVVIHGEQGAGKTLFMVKTAVERHKEFKHVYANFKLNGIKYKKFDLVEMYIEGEEIKDSLVLIDEGHMYFNARMTQTTFSTAMAWFFTQTRKRGNLVMITTIPGMLDINIRERAVFFHVFPQPMVMVNGTLMPVDPAMVLARDIQVRWFKIEIYNQILTTLVDRYFYNAEKYYKYYDTGEILFPDWRRLRTYLQRKKSTKKREKK